MIRKDKGYHGDTEQIPLLPILWQNTLNQCSSLEINQSDCDTWSVTIWYNGQVQCIDPLAEHVIVSVVELGTREKGSVVEIL